MAEDLPENPQAAEDSLPSTQEPIVNVVNPSGQLVGLPQNQVQDALESGYSEATPEDIAQAKYSSVGNRLGALAEGVGEGVAGPLFTAAERAAGVSGEGILGRREANTGEHMVGQGLGLAGSYATGIGEGALLAKVGTAASKGLGLGLKGAGLASKIGSKVVQGVVENSLFQGFDESTKLFAGDPSQSVSTVLSNIGYSAVLGGEVGATFGSVSPLWQATMGGKTNAFLKGLTERLGGREGLVSETVDQAITDSGLNIPPEVRAAASQDPWVRNIASTLEQTDTAQGGLDFQQAMQTARKQASEGITEALGKTEQDLASVKNQSNFEKGETVQEQVSKEYKKISEPIAKAYEQIESKFKDIEVPNETKALTQENIAQAIETNGWKLLPDSEELRLANRATQGLNNVKSLEDLRKLQSNIGAEAVRNNLWKAKSSLDGIFSQAREGLLDSAVGLESPELKAQFKQTQAAYRDLMQKTDELNSRLKLGNVNGPRDFLFKLQDQNAETTLTRLGRSNDAALLQFLSEHFPETAQSIRDFHIHNILDKAAETTAEGAKLNSAKALKAVQNMSPELREFALPQGASQRIQSIQTFLKAIEDQNHNFSNTARTVDKLKSLLPQSPLALVSALTGHNPLLGFLLDPLVKYLGKDVPAAAKLGLLKFLGSKAPIESGGFKAMVDFIHAMQKGESTLTKATTGVFKAARDIFPTTQMPSEKDRSKLEKQIEALSTNSQSLFKMGGSLGHYLPDHATTLSQMGMQAIQYLSSLKPSTTPQNPLDAERKPTSAQQSQYENALNIAEKPLLVLQKMKDGLLTTADLQHLQNLYPGLYQRMSQKLNEAMMTHLSDGESVPYSLRMGLSLFLAKPMDSTLTPQGIQATQNALHSMPMAPSQQGKPTAQKHSMNALNKIGMHEATAGQQREAQRGQRP